MEKYVKRKSVCSSVGENEIIVESSVEKENDGREESDTGRERDFEDKIDLAQLTY
jgi:hypothetical protein